MNRKGTFSIVSILIVVSILLLNNKEEVKSNNLNKVNLNLDTNEVDNFTEKIDDIDELLNFKIEGIIYFGRDTCPYCQNINKLISKELELSNELVIYKFDTDYWRKNEKFNTVLEQYNITSVPTLIKFNNGKIQKSISFDFENSDLSEIQEELSKFLIK